MIDIKRVILTILEDCNVTFRMRPIDWPFAKRLFLALVVPSGEDGAIDIEFYFTKGSQTDTDIEVKEFTTSLLDPGTKTLSHKHHYELSDQEEFDALSEYLKMRCSNETVAVEFSSLDDLDFEMA